MPATAENLRDLHALHERAKALRDRLVSGPKTLAARKVALAGRQAALEVARKALQDQKVQVKTFEHTLQGQQSRSDDLRVKLNQVKKNEEYKAIQNQLAHDKLSMEKLEGEVLEAMIKVDERSEALKALESEAKKAADDVAAMEAQLQTQSVEQEAQLAELQSAIAEAEAIIPADQRDQYRRLIKQRGAEAFASVDMDSNACSGCFVSVTHQMINELINCEHLTFCKTCGRILYLAEDRQPVTRRSAR